MENKTVFFPEELTKNISLPRQSCSVAVENRDDIEWIWCEGNHAIKDCLEEKGGPGCALRKTGRYPNPEQKLPVNKLPEDYQLK